MKAFFYSACTFFLFHPAHHYSQILQDSIPEVTVTVYPSGTSQLRSASSVSILSSEQLQRQPGYSLVPALNTVAGVRMEERSPGSYRLSVRGSVLRSPFGVRNLKLYMDEFPLTDAGGNTYLNALDAGDIRRAEILKGPEGSMFGANTGGVLRFSALAQTRDSLSASAGISGGSYGLFRQHLSLDRQWNRYRLSLYEGYQQSQGYRDHSAFNRFYLHTLHEWTIRRRQRLKLMALYSNLSYQTPGGLTQTQYDENPEASRPAGGPFNSAADQQAAVYNRTFYLGVSHEAQWHKNLRHVLTVFGSLTHFRNPFITNYEQREENSGGLRTYLEWKFQPSHQVQLSWNNGAEMQRTGSEISNRGNRNGIPDTLQSSDKLTAFQHFYFSQLLADWNRKLRIEAAMSLNFYTYRFQNQYPDASRSWQEVNFHPELMPRLAIAYALFRQLVWRISASKGYSSPTLAEIRPSTHSIYTGLQAEKGWNYETGWRWASSSGRVQADWVLFYFQLDQAIVRRQDSIGADYFINSGGTRQKGMEAQVRLKLIDQKERARLQQLQWETGLSCYDFRFASYQTSSESYDGNRVTGVPVFSMTSNLYALNGSGVYGYVQYTYTDAIPLNDANTVHARPYHLLQLKAGYDRRMGNLTLGLFAGIDNLLNESYSLGNDLNAAGGRYFNAAPPRNYYGGVQLHF